MRSVPPYFRGGTLSPSGATWAMRMKGPFVREGRLSGGAAERAEGVRPPVGAFELFLLHRPEAREAAADAQEMRRRSVLDDAAVLEHHDPVEPGDGREAMRD